MKTILCPIDRSPQSDRLLKYVASLAKDHDCKIYLVSSLLSKKKEMANAVHGSDETNRLEEIHDYLSGVLGVPCGIVEEPIYGNLYKQLGHIADTFDIMAVLIMTSADEKGRKMDLKKIIHDTLIPILVIPDRFPYQKIKRLLYAYDYKHEPEPPLMQLNWIADWFDCEVVFITLLSSDASVKEENKLSSIHAGIKKSWAGSNTISFETIVYPNLPKGLELFLDLSNRNDLLVLSVNHQNILERVWHKRIIKGVLQYSNHPYLILHE